MKERKKNIRRYVSRLTVNRLVWYMYWMVIFSFGFLSKSILWIYEVKPYTDLRVAKLDEHMLNIFRIVVCFLFSFFLLFSYWNHVKCLGHQNVSTISTIDSMAQQITGIRLAFTAWRSKNSSHRSSNSSSNRWNGKKFQIYLRINLHKFTILFRCAKMNETKNWQSFYVTYLPNHREEYQNK